MELALFPYFSQGATILLVVILGAGFVCGFLGNLAVRNKWIRRQRFQFVNWLFLFAFLAVFRSAVHLPDKPVWFEDVTLVLLVILAWLLFKHFLNDVYRDVYLVRIKKQPVNEVFLDLAKFIFLIVLVVFVLKTVFRLNPGSILTSSAILTAVIGFSMQDTIGSLVSGLLIQLEKPFRVGDWIAVGDLDGRVVEINWRNTKIESVAKDSIVIPNNVISKKELINYSRPISQVQQRLDVGVGFEVPPIKVKTALEDVVKRSALVAEHPAPKVRLIEYGEFRVEYRIVYYLKRYDEALAARDELYTLIWYQFKRLNIPIPYPQRVVSAPQANLPDGMPELVDLIGSLGLFSGMPPGDVELLIGSSTVKTYLSGNRIVTKGEMDTRLFVVLEGRVAVSSGERTLAELGHGDVFGEMALLTDEPRTADVVVLDTTRCLEVDREGFRMILERNSAIVGNVTRLLRERSEENRQWQSEEKPVSEETLLQRFRRIFSSSNNATSG